MARTRLIKPGFCKNEFLAQLSFAARLLFAVLSTIADRAGRLEDRPMRIKGELFPYEDVDVDALLRELASQVSDEQDHPFIVRYTVAGRKYIQITKFQENQSPHRDEKESTIPAPPENAGSTAQTSDAHPTANVEPTECGLKQLAQGKGNKNKPKRFDEFWDAVPRKVDKGRAEKSYATAVRELSDREADPEAFLIERMTAFASSSKAKGNYCPYPSTWLNGKRFDDDPSAWEERQPSSAGGYDRSAEVSEADRKIREALNGSN